MQNQMKTDRSSRTNRTTLWQKAIAAVSVIALTVIIAWAVWRLPPFPDRMQPLVADHLSSSGVENPVTAVLLNFRGYDTLLEIGVLLLAAVSVLSTARLPASTREASAPSSIQMLLLRLLLPFVILVGGYILWIGKYAPGGAFQAGAVLAAGGVLLATSAIRIRQLTVKLLPVGLTVGMLTFIGVALATMLVDGSLLQYRPAWAGMLILIIETAATISIAVILTVLFIGRQPDGGPSAGDQ